VRVLTISNLYPPESLGGYELGCSHVVAALRRGGHDVDVLTTSSDVSLRKDPHVHRNLRLAPVYNSARFELLPPDAQRRALLTSNFIDAGNVQTLAQAIEDLDPEVVYLWNLFGLGGLSLVACLDFAGVPWVWHLMDAVPLFLCSLGTPNIAPKALVPAIAQEFGRLDPGHFIVCSQRVHDEHVNAGVPIPGPTHLIPNWVQNVPDRPRRNFYREGHLRIVNAGQIGQHKGTDLLIEMAAALRDRGFGEYSIDIYGIGDDTFFRGLAAAAGVDDVVRFRGRRTQEDLLELYETYDVFVFPTWAREPFGFAPLEAASRGCVALVSADCGVAEWLVGGVDCLKAHRNPEHFAEVLAAILDSQIDLGSIGRRGQNLVLREFRLEAIVNRIEEILAQAVAEGPPAARRVRPADFSAIASLAEAVADVLLCEPAA
jgi:glycogen(starch) synthase